MNAQQAASLRTAIKAEFPLASAETLPALDGDGWELSFRLEYAGPWVPMRWNFTVASVAEWDAQKRNLPVPFNSLRTQEA